MGKHDWWCPIIGTLLVVAGAVLCVSITWKDNPAFLRDLGYTASFVELFTERSAWVVLATTLCVAVVTSPIYSIRIMRGLEQWRDSRLLSTWLLRTRLLAAVGFSGALAFSIASEQGESGVLWRPLAALGWPVHVFFHALNAIAVIPIVYLTSCVSLALFDKGECEPWSARRIRETRGAVKSQLLAGCIVLVLGVVELITVYRWIAATRAEVLVDGMLVRSDDFRQLGATVALCIGAGFSVLLAAIALPAFMVVKARTRELAERTLGSVSPALRDRWLKEEGLDLSLAATLKRAATISGPLLVGLTGGALIDWVNLAIAK
ncbi:MAG: hypothetical protein ABL982_10190 [Vicinamibacterales bacterium]